MVVALVALFCALDGPATAARLIDGGSIKDNSITTRQVRDRTLRTMDLSRAAVRTLQHTPSGSVGAAQLRGGAVGGGAIAVKAVDGTKLADGAVGANQLAAGAVSAGKVATGAIGADAIADGGLQTRDLGDFYGSVAVDFPPFAANTCKVAPVTDPQPSAPGHGNVIADDVVSVSPSTSGWPDPIVVTANPGAGNTIRIVACRIGGDATPLDPPPTTFQYVAFDSP